MGSAARPRTASNDDAGRRIIRHLLPLAAIVIAAAVGLALFRAAQWGTAVPGFDEVGKEPLVPELAGGAGNAGRVRITTEEAALELVRRGGRWLLASQYGYPARSDLAESFLRQLSALSVAYRADPDNRDYSAYGLHGPGEPASDAPRIEVSDRDGNALVTLTIGGTVSVPGGTALGTIAVRRENSSRMLLVTGKLQPSPDWRSWVDREIVNIPRATVTEFSVRPPGGRRLAVSRTEDAALRLSGAAEDGEQEFDATALDESVALLELLSFEDVRPLAPKAPADDEESWEASIRTGNRVQYWMTARPENELGMWATLSAQGTDENAAREALRFNGRAAGWEFRVGALGVERLTAIPRALAADR